MDTSDEMIRTEIQAQAESYKPPADLRERVNRGLEKQRLRHRSLMIAGVAASVMLVLVASVQPTRAAAAEMIKTLFTGLVGGTNYEVKDGPVIRYTVKVSQHPPQKVVSGNDGTLSEKESPTQKLTGAPGELPPEAADTLSAPFRLPAWIPENITPTVMIVRDQDGGEITWVNVRLGESIWIDQYRSGEQQHFVVTTDATSARKLTVGSAEVLEVADTKRTNYYWSSDGIAYTVSGPTESADLLKRLVTATIGQ